MSVNEASFDKLERIAAAIIDFANCLEAGVSQLKRSIAEAFTVQEMPSEEPFKMLVWERRNAQKLGEFEISAKDRNDAEAWAKAYNILKVSNANIKNHYGSKGWRFYYWLYDGYPNLIFRKARVQA